MRLLYLGDVVGSSGTQAVCEAVPRLIERYNLDAVIVNGENAADGFGITPALAEQFFSAGVDVLTTGNHVWDRKEILPYLSTQERILRPLNYPAVSPGRGSVLITTHRGYTVLVLHVMGRLYMDPLDDPFVALDNALGDAASPTAIADAVLIDVHAEATGEKAALAYYFDGRVSVVVGSHTHVPTADARILPMGTAFQSDAGMCGDYQSVIGMQTDEAIYRLTHKMSRSRPAAASGAATVCGILVETDPKTGLALRIDSLRIGGALSSAIPQW